MAEPGRTVEDENRLAQERALKWRRDVRDAFVGCFGPPEKATPYGAVMLKYIDDFCTRGRVQVQVDNNGATDVPQTFRNIGRREVADLIHNAIAWKESEHVNPSSTGT